MCRPRWSLLPALLLGASAMAQTNVYKCLQEAQVVYQQTPCQGRAEWRWEVPAEASRARAAAPPERARASAPRAPRAPAARARRRAQGAWIPLVADPVGCERARRRQITALARPRRLDYLQRRQLDDAVRMACK